METLCSKLNFSEEHTTIEDSIPIKMGMEFSDNALKWEQQDKNNHYLRKLGQNCMRLFSHYVMQYSSLDPLTETDENGDERYTEEKQDEFLAGYRK